MKIQPNNFNNVQLTEWAKLDLVINKGNNLKNKHARVMVLVHAPLSRCALQMFELSLKYLERLSSYREDTK